MLSGGGARVSWTAACYDLGADFADEMSNNEDPMPLDGNPHPLPGDLVPNNLPFVLPPFPQLRWSDAPDIAPQQPEQHDVADGWGHAVWGDNVDENEQPSHPTAPKQDQVSIVIDQPKGSVSVE